MFGIGMSEVFLILVVALIVLGPQKLPEIAKLLGRGFGEFRRATQALRETIDLESEKAGFKGAFSDIKGSVSDAMSEAPNAAAKAPAAFSADAASGSPVSPGSDSEAVPPSPTDPPTA